MADWYYPGPGESAAGKRCRRGGSLRQSRSDDQHCPVPVRRSGRLRLQSGLRPVARIDVAALRQCRRVRSGGGTVSAVGSRGRSCGGRVAGAAQCRGSSVPIGSIVTSTKRGEELCSSPLFATNVLLHALPQQSCSRPKHRSLSVEVAGAALALVVVGQVVLLPGPFADLGHVVVLVDIAHHGDPGLARRRAIGLRIAASPALRP